MLTLTHWLTHGDEITIEHFCIAIVKGNSLIEQSLTLFMTAILKSITNLDFHLHTSKTNIETHICLVKKLVSNTLITRINFGWLQSYFTCVQMVGLT